MGCGPSKEASNNVVIGNHHGHHVATHDEPMTTAEIESRIDAIEHTKSATFGGISVRYAYLSQRGYYPDGTCITSTPYQRSTVLYV
jgi:hypothetical protein